jgi:putative tryptophan/tyrosine transport system substrate-binding protein
MVPRLSGIALMTNPSSDPVTTELSVRQVEAAAQRLHLSFRSVEAQQPDQIARAFSSNQNGTDGVMVDADGLFFRERKRIAELALKSKTPTSVFDPAMVEDGGLMTYAPDVKLIFRRSASYIDKILKGAKPDELPIEQPTKFNFVINFKTDQNTRHRGTQSDAIARRQGDRIRRVTSSVSGTQRTFEDASCMSAFGGKPDIRPDLCAHA